MYWGEFDAFGGGIGDLVEVDVGLVVSPAGVEQVADFWHGVIFGYFGDLGFV